MVFTKIYIKRLIVRSLFLVVASSVVGLIVNAVRTPNVELFGFAPPKQKIVQAADRDQQAVVSEIDLKTALQLLKTKGVVFVDARKQVEYASGHIPNAINIPAELFSEAFSLHKQSLTKAGTIVTYCSDAECDEAYELAEALRETLGKTIKVFAGGMKEYGERRPVER